MTRFLRLGTALAGIALMGYGLYGLLNDHYITGPSDVLVWAVGGLVLHDGLWVPAVCLAGARFARGRVLRAWLIVAAALSAVGLPAVLRAGTDNGNPTLLPLPYLRNYLLVLAATAAVALLGVAAAAVRRRGRRAGPG
ncbi:hypothetical protein OG689_34995 [Kitasatospora sp. NBC_00240]|uniref:hypothetical protein n=1 Tax=Kitasatospora sp. NBC_00240 TaxID=2903567 RepID=UPI002255737F|nr:hypothetical protein [Kitasatospora sp. NBC_00240]MCX5214410.1 hypothetical protein [Kitasatospora sp. NBC_00240]